MTAAKLRSCCLDKKGAVEEFPFGPDVSVFKVRGKVFALSHLGARPLSVSLKCDPDVAETLRRNYRAVRPGYHLNKRHWNTITIDGSLPSSQIVALIDDSYDLVVAGLPAAVRTALR